MRVLVVRNPFGGHAVGAEITDPAAVERVLKGENAHHVVMRIDDRAPAPVVETAAEVEPVHVEPVHTGAEETH